MSNSMILNSFFYSASKNQGSGRQKQRSRPKIYRTHYFHRKHNLTISYLCDIIAIIISGNFLFPFFEFNREHWSGVLMIFVEKFCLNLTTELPTFMADSFFGYLSSLSNKESSRSNFLSFIPGLFARNLCAYRY